VGCLRAAARAALPVDPDCFRGREQRTIAGDHHEIVIKDALGGCEVDCVIGASSMRFGKVAGSANEQNRTERSHFAAAVPSPPGVVCGYGAGVGRPESRQALMPPSRCATES